MSVVNFVEKLEMRRTSMRDQEVLHQMVRVLQDISDQLAKQRKVMESLNRTLSEQSQKPSNNDKPIVVPPIETQEIVYGWSMALLAQREGRLFVGDIKIEDDESRWLWTGKDWERMETPSASR